MSRIEYRKRENLQNNLLIIHRIQIDIRPVEEMIMFRIDEFCARKKVEKEII